MKYTTYNIVLACYAWKNDLCKIARADAHCDENNSVFTAQC